MTSNKQTRTTYSTSTKLRYTLRKEPNNLTPYLHTDYLFSVLSAYLVIKPLHTDTEYRMRFLKHWFLLLSKAGILLEFNLKLIWSVISFDNYISTFYELNTFSPRSNVVLLFVKNRFHLNLHHLEFVHYHLQPKKYFHSFIYFRLYQTGT